MGVSEMADDSGENVAVKVARGLNTLSRVTGLPYNKGAVGVQTIADMKAAEAISDAVPRRAFGGDSPRAFRGDEN